MPEELVGAPFLGEFYSGASEVAMILVKLRLEAAEKREGIGRRAGKSGENFLLIEPPNLLGAMLDN